MPVNSARSDYTNVADKWQRLRDCFEGRDAILKAGIKYVPELPGADIKQNQAYRERGNFFNAVQRTVQGMVGAVFQEPPEVKFPKSLEDYLKDITLTNVPFEMFAVEAGNEIVLLGRYGVLVDMPAVDSTSNRPYACAYKAENIVNWKVERINGDQILTMVVLKEVAEVPDPKDEFVNKCVTQYRVLKLAEKKCVRQLYREKDDGSKEFIPYEAEVTMVRRGVALDFIPFVFLGSIHATPDIDRPPLLDLADVNIGHWKNSVDHEHGLHLVALPTPWVSGVKGSGDSNAPLKIGPMNVWELEATGTAGMLEFSGAGLESLVVAMDEKKKQMATLGARLLEDTPQTQETASAVKMRHSGEHASLRTVAGAIELGFTMALQIVAWWAGTEATPKDTDVLVELNKEYLNIKASPEEVRVALTALQAGEISFETWWQILAEGGWAPEGVTFEDERKKIGEDEKLKPEPIIDPTLSPGEVDPNNPTPPKPPAKKIITKTKTGYEVTEG